jgi:hypothetical protein
VAGIVERADTVLDLRLGEHQLQCLRVASNVERRPLRRRDEDALVVAVESRAAAVLPKLLGELAA